ncbi:MAG: enoyl-CoA hydratase/isomerase family protein, partial [Oceanospirillaceae bacterium]|nr:enoyl-CoA hydratase/isomerase family protein [Oceanospirillaceae bacterium]
MAALTEMADYTLEQDIAVITINNPPVNALSHGVRQGLLSGIEKALGDDDVKAIVLICTGRTFIAGADISEFSQAPKEPGLHDVLSAMDNSAKPIVAAIHGTALGGGLETALCCHYRVAVTDARFGLPEVNLGLLPGAGGTQRLPRVVGVEKALQMVTSGVPIGAPEALKEGLVDMIADKDLLAEAIVFAQSKVKGSNDHPRVRDNDGKLQSAR